MSTNSQTGDHVHENSYGNILGSYGSEILQYLSVEEKAELETLRIEVKILKDLCLPEKFKEFWLAGYYSGKLAEQTGETSVNDMDKFYSEDLEQCIKVELNNLDEEYLINGESEED